MNSIENWISWTSFAGYEWGERGRVYRRFLHTNTHRITHPSRKSWNRWEFNRKHFLFNSYKGFVVGLVLLFLNSSTICVSVCLSVWHWSNFPPSSALNLFRAHFPKLIKRHMTLFHSSPIAIVLLHSWNCCEHALALTLILYWNMVANKVATYRYK